MSEVKKETEAKTKSDELQIKYSKAAYMAGDLSYKIKCFQSELEVQYKAMAEASGEMIEYMKKEEPAKKVEGEVVA